MNPAALQAALNGDIANAIAASTPGGIERQEADGQRAMIASSQLPRTIHGATRQQLEALGIQFGADVDDVFVSATLPPGWVIKATSHSMHSDLLDEHGRKRAGIFYKAAFYDRHAHMSMTPRYKVDAYRPCNADGTPVEYTTPDNTHFNVSIMDGDQVLQCIGIYADRDYAQQKKLEESAIAGISNYRPDWRNPLAYWNEPEPEHV
jgi:hypothetical protein